MQGAGLLSASMGSGIGLSGSSSGSCRNTALLQGMEHPAFGVPVPIRRIFFRFEQQAPTSLHVDRPKLWGF